MADIADSLITLLEAERAGVAVSRALIADTEDQDFTALLVSILDGERKSCRILGRLILSAGESGGSGVGDFADKVMALDDDVKRLELLVKGQEWVLRKLDELLTEEFPDEFIANIGEIRDVHVHGIGLCKRFLERG